jgi:hypothetical protein
MSSQKEKDMLGKTIPVAVAYGQDTACNHNETIGMPVGMSDVDMRVVCATTKESGKTVTLVEDMGVEPRYHDSGLVLASAIHYKDVSVFFEAASECGKTREEAVAAILEFYAKIKEEGFHGQM